MGGCHYHTTETVMMHGHIMASPMEPLNQPNDHILSGNDVVPQWRGIMHVMFLLIDPELSQISCVSYMSQSMVTINAGGGGGHFISMLATVKQRVCSLQME